MENIRLHKEHGVNPSVEKRCFCNDDIGVVLFGAACKKEAPHYVNMGHICDRCKGVINSGGVFIFEACGSDVAQRTGRMIALSAEARKRLLGAKKSNVVHMEPEAFERLFGSHLKKGDSN